MVTDAQYRDLQLRVQELEKKLNNLSIQMSRFMLKGDIVNSVPQASPGKRRKDTTKYLLDGELFCKRRLAYACVKKYITENSITSYEDAVKIFPDYLQGSLGVIKPASIANNYSNSHRRFYFADDDILFFSGDAYVVCSQWEMNNICRILTVAENLGYKIEPIYINNAQ